MTRDQLTELGYIVPIDTVPSILKHGILSHRRASKWQHQSIADDAVQGIRGNKIVPGGLPLHDYANIYICPRNPMLYRRKDMHAEICVLRVSTAVLDLKDVVVTNANAARTFARFRPAPDGLSIVDHGLTFATYWTHDDPDEQYRRKGLKCAEVLVPHIVPADFVDGAYVSCDSARKKLETVAPDLPLVVRPGLFFV